jgi:hypothetical protein
METFRRITTYLTFLFLFTQIVHAKYQWEKREDPSLIVQGYETNFMALPTKGKLKVKPWSGDYWATYRGGITYRWLQKSKAEDKYKYDFADASTLSEAEIRTLSPAEKFDLYKGDSNWTITKLERDRTQVMTNKKIERWWGLCHAWAPATIMYDSPDMVIMKSKRGKDIPFYASDVKALLTYNIHLFGGKKKTHFMGSRCNVSLPKFLKALALGMLSEDRYLNAVRNEECNDMDPGAVHVALTNLIGKKKLGFVMDKTRGSEVWNQGVYAYDIMVEKTSKRKKFTWRGMKVIGKVHRVKTKVIWVNEISHTMKRVSPDKGLRPLIYKYDLYEDEDGDIIGGKWRQTNRPDFFWRIEDPGIHDMMVGLNDIYKKSITTRWQDAIKRRSRHELFNLFKKTAKKVRHSQAFIRNTGELVAARKSERVEYYNELKQYYLKNYKELMKRYR